MFHPRENVSDYFGRAVKTFEGVLLLFLFLCYLLAFLFFDQVAALLTALGGEVGPEYRIAFLLMPVALVAGYLWLSISADRLSSRVLTVIALLILAGMPVLRIFFRNYF